MVFSFQYPAAGFGVNGGISTGIVPMKILGKDRLRFGFSFDRWLLKSETGILKIVMRIWCGKPSAASSRPD